MFNKKNLNTVQNCKDCGKVTKGFYRCYECNTKHKAQNKPVEKVQIEETNSNEKDSVEQTKPKELYHSGTVCKFCAYDKFTPEEVKEIMNIGYFFNSNPCSGCKAQWHAGKYI